MSTEINKSDVNNTVDAEKLHFLSTLLFGVFYLRQGKMAEFNNLIYLIDMKRR